MNNEGEPLAGRKIIVTRSLHQASELMQRLADLGAQPIACPVTQIHPVESEELDAAVSRLSSFAWIVFTSVNAANAIAEYLRRRGIDMNVFGDVRVAAVGPATSRRLVAMGLSVAFQPKTYTARALALDLPEGDPVLALRAEQAAGDLPRILNDRGRQITDVACYRLVGLDSAPQEVFELDADAVTFTSPSTVRHFVRLARGRTVPEAIVCIGTETATAARQEGLAVTAVAGQHTIDGLVRSLVQLFSGKQARP